MESFKGKKLEESPRRSVNTKDGIATDFIRNKRKYLDRVLDCYVMMMMMTMSW
jgi:hypothetical protein